MPVGNLFAMRRERATVLRRVDVQRIARVRRNELHAVWHLGPSVLRWKFVHCCRHHVLIDGELHPVRHRRHGVLLLGSDVYGQHVRRHDVRLRRGRSTVLRHGWGVHGNTHVRRGYVLVRRLRSTVLRALDDLRGVAHVRERNVHVRRTRTAMLLDVTRMRRLALVREWNVRVRWHGTGVLRQRHDVRPDALVRGWNVRLSSVRGVRRVVNGQREGHRADGVV